MTDTPHTNTSTSAAVTRRDVLGAAAGLAIGSSLTGTAAAKLAGFAPVAGRETLRVGLVGCGGRGTGAAIQAISADPNNHLYAMADLWPDRIDNRLDGITGEIQRRIKTREAKPGAEHQIQVDPSRRFAGFDGYKQVIDSCDVVLLTTPPCFRPMHLRAAVQAGKHVFCEKPVAVDAPGVRSVIESARIAKQKNLSVMSGFCWRHQMQVVETFQTLLAGGIGDITSVQSTYNTSGWNPPVERQPGWSDTEFQLRNWQYFTAMSGDHIVEQAIHAIDWIAWAYGDVPPISCVGVGGRMTRPDTPASGNVWDSFGVTFNYDGGRRAYHMCRHWPNTPGDNTAYMLGAKGQCIMDPWAPKHIITGQTPWTGLMPNNDMYQAEHDTLFKAIRNNDRFDDAERMAHTTLLAIMARMACYTGEIVTWEKAMDSRENLNPGNWGWNDRAAPLIAIPGQTKLV